MIELSFLPNGTDKPFTVSGNTVQGILDQLPDYCPPSAGLRDLSVKERDRWIPLDKYVVERGLISPFELTSY